MQPRCFLETNILVYAFVPDQPDKQAKARHKFRKPLTSDYLRDLVDLLLAPKCAVHPTSKLWTQALAIQADTQYHFYDSLIVAAAIESGAPVLYSEDLQHGRVIGHLRILNPFLD